MSAAARRVNWRPTPSPSASRASPSGASRRAADVLDEVGIDPAIRSVFTEYEEHRLRENVKKGVALWKVRAVFGLDDFDTRLAQLNGCVKPLGEVISTLPSAQAAATTTPSRSIWCSAAAGPALSIEALAALLADRLGADSTDDACPFERPARGPRKPACASFRRSRHLNAALSMQVRRRDAGRRAEPAIAEPNRSRRHLAPRRADERDRRAAARAQQHSTPGRGARAVAGGTPLPKLWAQELQKESRALERKLDELQNGVLEVRMVPLVQVFDKLARLMRRLVRQSGKDVHFEVAGGDVELDKLIVEELSDPLMHLLRNALDHGIENPERAHRAGQRRARGVIRLKALQQGNHVVIEVDDDGAGIDETRIREVAIEHAAW